MENDPELMAQAKFLGSLSSNFAAYAELIREASYQVRKRSISDYPLFIASKVATAVAPFLIEPQLPKHPWGFAVSFLEMLQSSGLVADEQLTDFKQIYKPADEYCCLLVVEPDFVNFVFIPYPNEESDGLVD